MKCKKLLWARPGMYTKFWWRNS